MKRLVKVCIAIIMCFGLFLVVNNRVNAEDNASTITSELELRLFLNSNDVTATEGTLQNDITINGSTSYGLNSIAVKRNKTLNLNGHKITVNVTDKIGDASTGYALFNLVESSGYGDPTLVINGSNGTIDLNEKGRIFYFSDAKSKLTINGGTYTRGKAFAPNGTDLASGGMMWINLQTPGSVVINDATITNCVAKQGGAITSAGANDNSAPLTINNTKFTNNKAVGTDATTTGGGAIDIGIASGDVVLKDVTITGNTSEGYAGGIYIKGHISTPNTPSVTLDGKIIITDNTEKNNQSSNLYLTNDGQYVNRVTIGNNFDYTNSRIKVTHSDGQIIVDDTHGASAQLVNNFLNDYQSHEEVVYVQGTGLKLSGTNIATPCTTSTAANTTCSISTEQQLRDWAANPNSGITGEVTQHVGFNKTLEINNTVNVKQTGSSGTKTLSLRGMTIKASNTFNGSVMFNCNDPSPSRENPITITFNGGTNGSSIDGNNKARLFNVGYLTGESSIQLGIEVIVNNIKGHNGVGDYGGYAYVADAKLTIDGTTPQNNNYISEIYNCEANGTDPYSYGGAILVENVADLVVNNTKIHSNKSSNGVGGAIALEANSLISDYPNATINHCILTENSAVRAGGAIYHNGWNLTVLNSSITANTVDNYKWSSYEYEGNGAGIFLSTRNLQHDSTGVIQSNHPNGLVVGGDVYIYGNLGKYKEGGNTIEFPNNVYINYEHEDYRRYIRQDTTSLTGTSVIGVSITDSNELRKQPKITVAKGFDGLLNCFRFDFWKYGLDIDSNKDINLDEITIYLADDGKAYKNSETEINEITTQLKYANDIEMYTGNIEYKNSRWEINNFDFSTSKTHTIEVEPNQTVLLYGNNTLKNTSTTPDHAVLYSSGDLTLVTSSGNPYTITDASASNNGYGLLATGLTINGNVNTPINVNSDNGIGTKVSSVTLTAGKLISRGGTKAIEVATEITGDTFVKGSVERGASISIFDPATYNNNTYEINGTIAKAISVDEDYGLYLDSNGVIHKTNSSGPAVSVSGISYDKTNKVWNFNNVKHSTHKATALQFQDNETVRVNGTNSISTDATGGIAVKVGDSSGKALTLKNANQTSYGYLNLSSTNDGLVTKDLTIYNGVIVDSKTKGDAIDVEGTLTLGVTETANHMYAEVHGTSETNIGIKTNTLAKNNNDIYLLAQGATKAVQIQNDPSITEVQVLGKANPTAKAQKATYSGDTYQIAGANCIYVAINAQNYSIYIEDGQVKACDNSSCTVIEDGNYQKLGIDISPDGKRVALKNCNFRTTNNYGIGIKAPDDGSVELIIDGVNSININEPTIQNSGAIYVNGTADLVINGYNGATINAHTASIADDGCAAIYVPEGNLTINNVNINASSGDTDNTHKSVAIKASDIYVKSSNIKASSDVSTNSVAILCDSLTIDDDSTLTASGKQYAINFNTENGIKAKYIYGTDVVGESPRKAIKIKELPTELKSVAKRWSFLYNLMASAAPADVSGYTYVLADGTDSIVKTLGLNTYKPSPGPSPDPQPKDESCEKVLGPTWHWNNAKGICEDTGVVKTFSR